MSNTTRRKYYSNEIIVNNKSSFKSHLVRGQQIVDNIHFDELVVKAMGKATTRALNLATQLNANNFNTFEIIQRPYSVDILEDRTQRPLKGANKDGFDPEEIDVTVDRKTKVPAIEIRVRKHRLEIDRMRSFRGRDKNQSHKK